MKQPIYLGVNVDHIATIRQARGVTYPDPVHAALQAEVAGADSITMHLREDRRHIQKHDIQRFAASTQTRLNLGMAATEAMRDTALAIKPRDVCIVPENREELTTESGLDVINNQNKLKDLFTALHEAGIRVSLLVDPEQAQIDAAALVGAPVVELHTGHYAKCTDTVLRADQLANLVSASDYAFSLGFIVNAGHGLHVQNVQAIAEIESINELTIGHSLIARSLFLSLPEAVKEMKQLMMEARYR